MNLISDSIKCTKCKEILKIPVLLPCGHSICNHHVNDDKNESESASSSLSEDTNNENRKFECLICEKFHDIPLNGFPRERALESLLEKNIEKIDLGKEYKSAIDKCSLFADLLDRFYKLKNDPLSKINEEISELKNTVDLRREEMKLKIDKESLEMIEKLDEFEKECKLKAVSLKFDSNLDEKLKNSQKSLKEWQQSLNSFERNIDNWTRVLKESTSTLKDLHKEFINFNRELFLNRLIEFKYPNLLASNKFIILKLEVNELSKYIDTKEKKTFDSPSVFIDEIQWFINVDIENLQDIKSNKNETYIGVYLFATQKPNFCNLKVEFDLVILDQFGMNKSIVASLDNVFGKFPGRGNPKFISLKDLIADSNLYNAQNDSCTVQAIVKKFEWI